MEQQLKEGMKKRMEKVDRENRKRWEKEVDKKR